MVKNNSRVFLLAILLATLPATSFAQSAGAVADNPAGTATTILSSAAKAMGAENLKTLHYSGSGSSYAVGQNVDGATGWPHRSMKSYERDLNFEATASRVQLVRLDGEPPVEHTENQLIAAGSPWATQFDYWITPYGFLKGAMANQATAETKTVAGVQYKVVTFLLNNKDKLLGYFTDEDMLDKVEARVDHPVLGELLVETLYRDYTNFNGLKFPTTIIQKQGGFLSMVLIVKDVKPNAAVNLDSSAAQARTP